MDIGFIATSISINQNQFQIEKPKVILFKYEIMLSDCLDNIPKRKKNHSFQRERET